MSTHDQPALLPCPFCGSIPNHADISDRGYPEFWQIVCQGCGVSGPEFAEATKSQALALAWWNKRPIEEALRAQLKEPMP